MGWEVCKNHSYVSNKLIIMKKVLVTGATGFIGGYVIKELLSKGYEVIATSTSREKAMSYEWYDKVDFIPCDLKAVSFTDNLYNFFDKPDMLIHLAWEGLPNYKSGFHLEENLPRHYTFLKKLIQQGLNDVTVAGTCLEYGMVEGCLNEDMVPHPANPYAVAKNSLRNSLEILRQEIPFIFKWIRLFYMYGKGQNPNSLFSQLEAAIASKETIFNMSGGEQIRDFLPVGKAAEYITKIALQNKVKGIINCCSGKPVSLKQLVQEYLKKRDALITLNLGHYPYTDYEPMCFWGDTKKLNLVIEE